MSYRFKLRKGNSGFSTRTFFTPSIQNDRVMSKRESYDHFVSRCGGKKADYQAIFCALGEYVKDQCGKGNATNVDGFVTFTIRVKGGFQTSQGPWVRGKNYLQIACSEHVDFRKAITAADIRNVTTGDKPTIKSILDTEIEEYDVLRVGDKMSLAGTNLAPDITNEDEFVALYKGDTLIKKATVTLSELNTVEFKIEGITLEPGDYRIGVFTRCGDSAEGVSVKSTFRSIKVVTAA